MLSFVTNAGYEGSDFVKKKIHDPRWYKSSKIAFYCLYLDLSLNELMN